MEYSLSPLYLNTKQLFFICKFEIHECILSKWHQYIRADMGSIRIACFPLLILQFSFFLSLAFFSLSQIYRIKRFVLLSCVNRFFSFLFLLHDQCFFIAWILPIRCIDIILTKIIKIKRMAARWELMIPMTMIKRKMETKKSERAAHDNKSKYIVFNMSMNANVNTSELSNGHNHTEFTYCRVSDIYIFVSFFSLVETWLIWPQNICMHWIWCSVVWKWTFFCCGVCYAMHMLFCFN